MRQKNPLPVRIIIAFFCERICAELHHSVSIHLFKNRRCVLRDALFADPGAFVAMAGALEGLRAALKAFVAAVVVCTSPIPISRWKGMISFRLSILDHYIFDLYAWNFKCKLMSFRTDRARVRML